MRTIWIRLPWETLNQASERKTASMEINGIEVNEAVTYNELPLTSDLLKAIEKKGFTQATPIQAGAIPPLLEWKDVIAKAPTGTGKTLAFGIPIVEHINIESTEIQALILAPTRELAIQITDELRDLYAFREGVRSVCLYGGQPIDRQILQLKKKPQIIVATPGRLMDHIKRRTVKLEQVQTVVLDEADRMLDMGFIQDVTRILNKMTGRKNLGLFSATISRAVMDISWVYQRDPVEITVRPVEENKPDIQQYRIDLDGRNTKVDTLDALLRAGGYDRAIAFCNTKNMTDRLSGLLKMRGYSAEAIHGDIQQKIREKTLDQFRQGNLQILVATDVAARGLDIDDVDVVFNFDVPDEQEYYVHRIGRTGRAKKHGVAYSLVSNITEGIRLDEIARNTKADMIQLRYDQDGCLLTVEK
jgi:ATP-dependent RNA helicase DeaD